MTTLEKLKRYEEAYRKHVRAKARNDPWAQYPLPEPTQYGLKSTSDLHMVRVVADRVDREKV